MANLGSRQIADMIAETIRGCSAGYPDAPLVLEGFAYDYAAKMKAINPTFRQKAFINRALRQRN